LKKAIPTTIRIIGMSPTLRTLKRTTQDDVEQPTERPW